MWYRIRQRASGVMAITPRLKLSITNPRIGSEVGRVEWKVGCQWCTVGVLRIDARCIRAQITGMVLRVGLRQQAMLASEHSETWNHYRMCQRTKKYATGHTELTKKTRPLLTQTTDSM